MLALLVAAVLATATGVMSVSVPIPHTHGSGKPSFGKYFDRFMVIVMENESYDEIYSDSNFQEFATQGRLLTNYHGVTHPSLPNYLTMIAGDYFNITDDARYDLPASDLTVVDLFEAKGVTWKSYLQNYIPLENGACNTENNYNTGERFAGNNKICDYQRKHNPFMSFINISTNLQRCQNIVGASLSIGGPGDNLLADIESGNLADYIYYVPEQCRDGHNSSPAYSGQWLKDNFFGENGYLAKLDNVPGSTLVMITYDENDFTSGIADKLPNGKQGNLVYSLLMSFGKKIGPRGSMDIKAGETCDAFNSHYGMLEMVEANWGLGNLGRNDDGSTAAKYGGELCVGPAASCGC